jgi:hypothetical protein
MVRNAHTMATLAAHTMATLAGPMIKPFIPSPSAQFAHLALSVDRHRELRTADQVPLGRAICFFEPIGQAVADLEAFGRDDLPRARCAAQHPRQERDDWRREAEMLCAEKLIAAKLRGADERRFAP